MISGRRQAAEPPPEKVDVVIADAWMLHPSAEFLADSMFDSLRRGRREHRDAVRLAGARWGARPR
jgi:hypothetical protein